MENVITVDADDNPIATMEKMEAHVTGVLHRAFSIFIFNSKGELLIQQRALSKYHSPGIWSNTCCSHPRPGETTPAGANRRLIEEMGMTCTLNYLFNFIYRAQVAKDLIEHEFDHVYYGVTDELPMPNQAEVLSFNYMAIDELETQLKKYPEKYSQWLHCCFSKMKEYHHQIFKI